MIQITGNRLVDGELKVAIAFTAKAEESFVASGHINGSKTHLVFEPSKIINSIANKQTDLLVIKNPDGPFLVGQKVRIELKQLKADGSVDDTVASQFFDLLVTQEKNKHEENSSAETKKTSKNTYILIGLVALLIAGCGTCTIVKNPQMTRDLISFKPIRDRPTVTKDKPASDIQPESAPQTPDEIAPDTKSDKQDPEKLEEKNPTPPIKAKKSGSSGSEVTVQFPVGFKLEGGAMLNIAGGDIHVTVPYPTNLVNISTQKGARPNLYKVQLGQEYILLGPGDMADVPPAKKGIPPTLVTDENQRHILEIQDQESDSMRIGNSSKNQTLKVWFKW